MGKIRVLIVEDSVTVREQFAQTLSADPEIAVVGKAADGKTAIELCQALRPDVMTLDMMLGELSGLAVTEYVMAYCPTPILIVSSSTNRGDVYKTYEALAAGALDVLDKSRADQPHGNWEREFVAAVKLASRIKVITHVRGRRSASPAAEEQVAASRNGEPPRPVSAYQLIAIGASTGGPAALLSILRRMPASFALPILVVNHVADTFGSFLAEWLGNQTPLSVSCAVDGEPVPAPGEGRVILARPGYHLAVHAGRLRLISGNERNCCRPSVDVLFESVAREIRAAAIGCLLTGMGKDGAAGLLAMRRAGARTLAQDEASSAVFGMAQAAILAGAVETILSLDDIAPALLTLALKRL